MQRRPTALNRSDLAKAAQHLLRLAVEYDLAHADQADYPVLILQGPPARLYRTVWSKKTEPALRRIVNEALDDRERRDASQHLRAVALLPEVERLLAELELLRQRKSSQEAVDKRARRTREVIAERFSEQADLTLSSGALDELMRAWTPPPESTRDKKGKGVLKRMQKVIGRELRGQPSGDTLESLRLVLSGTTRAGAVSDPKVARTLWRSYPPSMAIILRYVLRIFLPELPPVARERILRAWHSAAALFAADSATGRVGIKSAPVPPWLDISPAAWRERHGLPPLSPAAQRRRTREHADLRRATSTFWRRPSEQIVCECREGALVLEVDVEKGAERVCFPTEERWNREAPEWARPRYEEMLGALRAWCGEREKIPVIVSDWAGVRQDKPRPPPPPPRRGGGRSRSH